MIKSRYDPLKYPSEAYQFFYGDVEPYYVNIFSFPIIKEVYAQTIGQDLISVQPLGPPSGQLIDSLYTAAQIISANEYNVGNSRSGLANYIIVSPAIAEELNNNIL